MALKPCRECKKKVSTEANTCPSCGAPHPTLKAKDKIEPKYSYKFGEVKIENQKTKVVEVEDKNKKLKKELKNKNDIDIRPDGEYFFNGTKSIAVTFWGYLIGGNFIFIIWEYFLKINRAEQDITYFVMLIHLLWIVLATMGVFNSANIYKAKKIKLGQTYGIATAAKVATVVLILSAIGNAL